MPIRYIGSKAQLVAHLAPLVDHGAKPGSLVDVFGGMGALARAMVNSRSIVINDHLSFPVMVSRSLVLVQRDSQNDLEAIYAMFSEHRASLRRRYARRLSRESTAFADQRALDVWMKDNPHVGNSSRYRSVARAAGSDEALSHQLVTLYFSGGYFSTEQAIDLDALRFAIDGFAPDADRGQVDDEGSLRLWTESCLRDSLVAAWLATASSLCNSPGHTAQFLKPTSPYNFKRVQYQWSRNAWQTFVLRVQGGQRLGSYEWRSGNRVTHAEADVFVKHAPVMEKAGLVYLDPPYTKDHYSRMYHVLETLSRYDYPDSFGIGRTRSDRRRSSFCVLSEVEGAFNQLFTETRKWDVPVLVSYPSRGLLAKSGVALVDLFAEHFAIQHRVLVQHQHSTVGASKGAARTPVVEEMILGIP